MADNNQIKQHISAEERAKWNKVITDLNNHIGKGGISNHPLANGTVPGFSTNDFTNDDKTKLSTVQGYANNYTHPANHPASMITGLATVATTGRYADLIGIPGSLPANGGNSATVGGIRITIGNLAPGGPTEDKDIFFNTSNGLIYVFHNGNWMAMTAVYSYE